MRDDHVKVRHYSSEALTFALVGLATFAVFSQALRGEFLKWDDNVSICENPLIRSLDGAHLRAMFLDLHQLGLRYRPLNWLSWAIIYSQVGLRPFVYHLVPLVLHCLNAGMVFLIIRKLCSLAMGNVLIAAQSFFALTCAGLGALMWSLHPLRVEPVSWANALPYEQAAFFLFLSLLAYVTANEPQEASRCKPWYYVLSVTTFALALLTYPVVLTFPAVLFVLDFYPLRRFTLIPGQKRMECMGRIIVGKLPFLMLSVLFVLIALYVRVQPTKHWWPASPLSRFGLLPRMMQAFYIWAYYVWRPWWPADLSPVYTKLISFDPLAPTFMLSASGVILLTLVLIRQRKRWPALLAVWAAYLILLVPVLGLTEHPHFSSDRYSYLPGIGWSVLAVGLLLNLPQGLARRAGLIAAMVLTILLGDLSYRQVAVWRNTASLYEHAIKALGDDPFRYSFYIELAPLYQKQHNYPGALEYYLKIAAINPRRPDVFKNLGEVLVAMGRLDRAAEEYKEGLKISPQDANLYCGLGQVLAAKGDLNGATTNLNHALELNPQLASAQRSLGEILKRQGKLGEARMHFERATQTGETAPP
jgi:protein O-mannosyl-transferase